MKDIIKSVKMLFKGLTFRKLLGAFMILFLALFLAPVPAPAHEEDTNLYNLTTELIQKAKRYHQKQVSPTDVVNVAAKRKALMLSLLLRGNAEDVETFLRHSLPAGLRGSLPEWAHVLIEEADVSVQGRLTVVGTDYFKEGRTVVTFELNPEDQPGVTLSLHFAEHPHHGLKTGDIIRVGGTKLDNHLATMGGSSVQTVSSAEVVAFSGGVTVIVLTANFTDKTLPVSPPTLHSMFFTDTRSINAYYSENSFSNITSITGDVSGPYNINYTSTGPCDYTGWATALRNAATNAGVNLSNYKYKVYATPYNSTCGWAGGSFMGGTDSWNNGYEDYEGVFSHELGHNFGTHHASTPTSEYGDDSDVMGNGAIVGKGPHMNAPRKFEFAWLPSSNIQAITASGTYSSTISPLETLIPGAVEAITIPNSVNNDKYWLSTRQAVGLFDTDLAPHFLGTTSVHHAPGTGGQHTYLLATLADGQSYTDSTAGVTFTQTAHDANGATVGITYSGPACVKAAPLVSLSPLSATDGAGDPLLYTVRVTNLDSSVCPSTTFGLSNAVPSGWTSTLSPQSIQLAPGGSGSSSWTVTSPTGTADGSYPLSASATDVNDATHGASGNVTAVIYTDTTAPTVSFIEPANGSRIAKNGRVTISVSAVDDVGVAKVDISIDGVLLTTLTAAPYKVTWNTRKVSSGAHSLTAKGYDKAGNVGSAAVTVYK